MESGEFRCTWIDKSELWSIADQVRKTYWPEGTLPVDIEKIVDFGLTSFQSPNMGFFPQLTWTPILKWI